MLRLSRASSRSSAPFPRACSRVFAEVRLRIVPARLASTGRVMRAGHPDVSSTGGLIQLRCHPDAVPSRSGAIQIGCHPDAVPSRSSRPHAVGFRREVSARRERPCSVEPGSARIERVVRCYGSCSGGRCSRWGGGRVGWPITAWRLESTRRGVHLYVVVVGESLDLVVQSGSGSRPVPQDRRSRQLETNLQFETNL